MVRVFLSYDREDGTKARSIAQAFERAGHFVWWDRHIKGGAKYSREIDKALKAADAVVVLWSERAVESDWVRDEAAVGRDSGRLVPVSLDRSEPPLGFRQYQTIDLSGWSGRSKPPQLETMLEAVETIGDPARPREPKPVRTIASPIGLQTSRWLNPWLIIGVLIPILGLVVVRPWEGKPSIPAVTVVPNDQGAKSREIAGNLLVQLGSIQSANSDALQLIEPRSGAKPDMTFKVGATKVGATGESGAFRASLSLFDNRDGALLWSREFVQPEGNEADLRQQLAYSAAQVLDCTTEVLLAKNQKIPLPTLKLYLGGCADLSNLLAQNPQVVIPTFVKVTKQAPKFHGGWRKLLLAEVQAIGIFNFMGRSDQGLKENLRDHITLARRVDPSMSESLLAEGWLQPRRPISGWMKFADLAVAKDPDNPEILANHSVTLTNVGLIQEALADSRRAVEFNPLSPSARYALIVALLNSGQVETARKELERSERLWPGATSVLQSRFALEFRVGDPAKALRMLRSGELGIRFSTNANNNAAHESFLEARINPSPANVERALANAHALYRQDPLSSSWVYTRALAQFDRQEELIDFLLKVDPRVANNSISWVLFRSDFATLHRDRRFMVIARRLGLMDYWRDTGKWADFCSRPDLPYDCKAEAAKLR
jgi:tetratricopeptide (TPR) repeat protein